MRKLIVITGGTKGIGRAIVEKFATEGFDVITCARHESELISLKSDIEGLVPDCEVMFRAVDLADKEAVSAFVEFISSMNRPVDVLINNAGIFLPGEAHQEPAGNLEKMIETNLYSAYYLTRGLIEDMKSRGKGYVFNMCSIASILPYEHGSSYSISKHALLGFSKVLREEMKDFGVRVSAILPGPVYTPSWEGSEYPPERFIQPDDIGEAVYSAYNLSRSAVVEEILIRPQLGDI